MLYLSLIKSDRPLESDFWEENYAMNKYLIEILNAQESVIVTGLGQLTKKTYSTGLVHVKLDTSIDEGEANLSNFVSEKERISKQDAANQIAKYVKEIESELSKGANYEIFGLGKFSKTDAGNIYFITSNDSHHSNASQEATKATNSDSSGPVIKESKPEPKAKDGKEETATKKVEDDKPTKAAQEKNEEAKDSAKPKVVRRKTTEEESVENPAEKKKEEKNEVKEVAPAVKVEAESKPESKKEEAKEKVAEEKKEVKEVKETVPPVKVEAESKPESKKEEAKEQVTEDKKEVKEVKETVPPVKVEAESKPESKKEETKEKVTEDKKEEKEVKEAVPAVKVEGESKPEPKKEKAEEKGAAQSEAKASEEGEKEDSSDAILEDRTDQFEDHEPELVNKHLQEILRLKESVIITGFGQISGKTVDSGLLKFTFDSSVKSGDETLAAYLVVKNKIKEDKARTILSNYIQNIDAKLEKGEPFGIHGIGRFIRGEGGKKEFTTSSAPIWKSDDAVSSNEKETKPADKKVVVSDNPVKEVSSDSKETKDSSKNEQTVATAAKSSDKAASDKKTKESEKKDGGKAKSKKEEPKKKKSKLPIILIILILLAAGGAVAGYMFKDKIKALITDKSITATGDDVVTGDDDAIVSDSSKVDDAGMSDVDGGEESGDSLSEGNVSMDDDGGEALSEDGVDGNEGGDELPVDEVDVVANDEVIEPIDDGGNSSTSDDVSNYSGELRYHIIGNVFSDADNANKYVEELNAKGYSAQNLGIINKLNYVAVKSYQTKSEAIADIEKVKGDAPEAWVYRFPR